MAKVVYYDGTDGGFDLPDTMRKRVAERKGIPEIELPANGDLPRHDPDLVAVVEDMIEKGEFTDYIDVQDIGDANRYWIEVDTYYGWETVHTDTTEVPWVYIDEEKQNDEQRMEPSD